MGRFSNSRVEQAPIAAAGAAPGAGQAYTSKVQNALAGAPARGRRSRRLELLAAGGLLAAGAIAVALLVAGRMAYGYRPGPGDDRPPAEARYQGALQAGLQTRDYPAARRAFLALAAEKRQTSEGAWALYQAGLAAKAGGDPRSAEAIFARVRQEYPEHPLALRLKTDPPPAPARPVRKAPDCGPRSLLYLCRQAGIAATLPELVKGCGMDADGTTLEGLGRAAREKGLRSEAAEVDAWFLRRTRPAGIAWVQSDHFVAFLPGRDAEHVRTFDPAFQETAELEVEELERDSRGIVLLVAWGSRQLPEIGKS